MPDGQVCFAAATILEKAPPGRYVFSMEVQWDGSTLIYDQPYAGPAPDPRADPPVPMPVAIMIMLGAGVIAILVAFRRWQEPRGPEIRETLEDPYEDG